MSEQLKIKLKGNREYVFFIAFLLLVYYFVIKLEALDSILFIITVLSGMLIIIRGKERAFKEYLEKKVY